MEHHQKTTKPKSIAARVFLTLIGVGFFLFGLVAITCGFVINYHDDFEAKGGGQELETLIETQFDYSQYWLGVPFLITAALSLFSAIFPNRRSLTTATIVFFHACVTLALFAIVLEGVDWMSWKNYDRQRKNWEDKTGYKCDDKINTCICQSSASNKTISTIANCTNISALSGLFGAIVASAIVGIALSIAGIVVILKSLSWKPRHHYFQYDLQNHHPVQHRSYQNEVYSNGIAPRMAGKGAINMY